MSFVHLHTHSEYSMLDGIASVDSLVLKASQDGQPAIAITDHGNMLATCDLIKSATEHKIKPIIGCEFYVTDNLNVKDQHNTKLYHLVLLAKNITGYHNLQMLNSISFIDGFYYKPRIDFNAIREHHEGLVCLSGCLGGEIQKALESNNYKHAEFVASEYKAVFGDDYYLEVHNHLLQDEQVMIKQLESLGSRLNIKTVAAQDAHYCNQEDHDIHEIALCVGTNTTMDNPQRFRFPNNQFYLTTALEMSERFPAHMLEATLEIANKVEVFDIYSKPVMPCYQLPDGVTPKEQLEKEVYAGIRERIEWLQENNLQKHDTEAYLNRAKYELDVISQMDFPGYFLVVSDFVKWAKRNDIPVGGGRGSAAGSLVAWALRITDLDPLQHGLLFERFLNPERVSLPDIDIDFCRDGRKDVIEYVKDRYGSDYVANIVTINRAKSKAAIKDVARALGIDFNKANQLSKVIDTSRGQGESITDAIQYGSGLEYYESDEDARRVYDYAIRLEGLARSTGVHAAGIIIAPKPVAVMSALMWKNDTVVVQHEMSTVEKVGMIKIDMLGIEQLTQIKSAITMLESDGITIDPAEWVKLNDDKTLELFRRGDTAGIFQFESSGMAMYLKRLQPDRFADIVAMNALYRPGPLDAGVIDTYIKRRHREEETSYLLPELRPILESTYGIIIYQEQIMQIARAVAGYSLGEADLLRRAIGKKNMEAIQKEKDTFVNRMVINKFDKGKAIQLFDLIEKFANYGFNLSHAAAYALIAYQTAYLKAHHPIYFAASLLTTKSKNIDDMPVYIHDTKENGIKVLQPDVNKSQIGFSVVGDSILCGLTMIAGISDETAQAIVNARKSAKQFKSLTQFVETLGTGRAHSWAKLLILAGAFDKFGERDKLYSQVDLIKKAKKKNVYVQEECLFSQDEMDDLVQDCFDNIEYEKWSDRVILDKERSVLGCYISAHPADKYIPEFKKCAVRSIAYLKKLMADGEVENKDRVTVGGMVTLIEERFSKHGNRWAKLTLEDSSGVLECMAFSRRGEDGLPTDMVFQGNVVLVRGEISIDEKFGSKIIVNSIKKL